MLPSALSHRIAPRMLDMLLSSLSGIDSGLI